MFAIHMGFGYNVLIGLIWVLTNVLFFSYVPYVNGTYQVLLIIWSEKKEKIELHLLREQR